MNHPHHSPYLASPHTMAGTPSYVNHQATAGAISTYPPYQHQHQQHPGLPGPSQYVQTPVSYGHPSNHYGYSTGMPSPHGSSHLPSQITTPNLPSIPHMALTPQHSQYVHNGPPTPTSYQPPSASAPQHRNQVNVVAANDQPMDQSGQVAPAGMKPRVTATLWEDEGAMCFQVETGGICVARRDDNHMINGTKLLNVTGMTRGRRDGMLKSEKNRNVVKIGPMHLKGVWIPFDRALEFANKEKITDLLYPLFVHNIGALLTHPTNQSRTPPSIAALQERRRLEGQRTTQSTGSGPIATGASPPGGSTAQSVNSQQALHRPSTSVHLTSQSSHPPATSVTHSSARPTIDRSHTFPTPPTTTSGTLAGVSAQHGTYDWSGSGMSNGLPNVSSIGVEPHVHPAPATPASTPPGIALPSMQYPPHSALSEHYAKQEMGPPIGQAGGMHGKSHADSGAYAQSRDDYSQATTSDHQSFTSAHRSSYDNYGVNPYVSEVNDQSHDRHPVTSGASTQRPAQWSTNGVGNTESATGASGYQTPPQRSVLQMNGTASLPSEASSEATLPSLRHHHSAPLASSHLNNNTGNTDQNGYYHHPIVPTNGHHDITVINSNNKRLRSHEDDDHSEDSHGVHVSGGLMIENASPLAKRCKQTCSTSSGVVTPSRQLNQLQPLAATMPPQPNQNLARVM